MKELQFYWRMGVMGALLLLIVGLAGAIGFQLGTAQRSDTPGIQGFVVYQPAKEQAPSEQAPIISFEEALEKVNAQRDKPSPHDWISEDQIKVYDDKVVLEIKDARWARFSDTKSMDPLLDAKTTGIEIIPKGPEDIYVGDVVSYYSPITQTTVIHRVIEIGSDELGWYAKFKGDNNAFEDPGRIRYSQIRRILVAVVY